MRHRYGYSRVLVSSGRRSRDRNTRKQRKPPTGVVAEVREAAMAAPEAAAAAAAVDTGEPGGEQSPAAPDAVKQCWVVVERLGEGAVVPRVPQDDVGGASASPQHAQLKECRVVLQRVDGGVAGAGGGGAVVAVARARRGARNTKLKPTAKSALAAAVKEKAGQWNRRLRHGKRRQQASRDSALLKKAALQVTKRSAWRRGRARGWKAASSSTTTTKTAARKSATTSGTARTRTAPGTATARARTTSETSTSEEHKLLHLGTFSQLVKILVEDAGQQGTFAVYEKQVLQHWLELSEGAAEVYFRLLGLQGPWIRGEQVHCRGATAADVRDHFAALTQAGFVSSEIRAPDLKQLLDVLRRDELEAIAADLGVLAATKRRAKATKATKATKADFLRALLRFSVQDSQDGLARLQARLCEALGGCVRVLAVPRKLVERALLQHSAWMPAPRDGDRLRDARALLLRRVARPLALQHGPGAEDRPPPLRSMFHTRQQAVAWESVARERADLEDAVRRSHWPEVANLTEELLQCYRSHLTSCGSDDDLASRTLGNAFAEALTVAAEALGRSGEDKKALGVAVLATLVGQRHHAQEKRAHWVAEHAARLLHSAAGSPQGPQGPQAAAEMLIKELEDGGHRGAQRTHLELRARVVLRRKASAGPAKAADKDKASAALGLPDDVRLRLEGLLPAPAELPVRVMRLTALAGTTVALKRVYVHQTPGPGGKKHLLSVEERVMAKLAQDGEFPLGLDDEGETLVALAVLAFWGAVHDGGVDDAWGSPCQDRPLDWATDRFWAARSIAMEERCQELVQRAEAAGPEAVADDLLARRDALAGTPCLVRWRLLQNLDLQSLLKCITVPIFVAICRRILSDFSAYRSGFPDLLLWNPGESKSLFAEVKGPRDELAPHQAKWLQFLAQHGAAVAVVHVQARSK